MSDIVERLQTHAMRGDSPIAGEAATEITRLLSDLEKVKERYQRLAIDNAILHMKKNQHDEKQFKYWFQILVDWWENPERMIAAGEGSE